MLATIQDINSKLRCVRSLEAEKSDEEIPNDKQGLLQGQRPTPGHEDNITDEDLEDMFKVLRKQKEGLDILTKSVNDNTRQLMVMEREIDLHVHTEA